MTQQSPTAPADAGVFDDAPSSADDLIHWLERKYARHGEDEDRQAAEILRRLAAQPPVHDPSARVAAGKVQAKRLLKRVKKDGPLAPTALHEALEVVAHLHGYPHWQAMAATRPDRSPPVASQAEAKAFPDGGSPTPDAPMGHRAVKIDPQTHVASLIEWFSRRLAQGAPTVLVTPHFQALKDALPASPLVSFVSVETQMKTTLFWNPNDLQTLPPRDVNALLPLLGFHGPAFSESKEAELLQSSLSRLNLQRRPWDIPLKGVYPPMEPSKPLDGSAPDGDRGRLRDDGDDDFSDPSDDYFFRRFEDPAFYEVDARKLRMISQAAQDFLSHRLTKLESNDDIPIAVAVAALREGGFHSDAVQLEEKDFLPFGSISAHVIRGNGKHPGFPALHQALKAWDHYDLSCTFVPPQTPLLVLEVAPERLNLRRSATERWAMAAFFARRAFFREELSRMASSLSRLAYRDPAAFAWLSNEDRAAVTAHAAGASRNGVVFLDEMDGPLFSSAVKRMTEGLIDDFSDCGVGVWTAVEQPNDVLSDRGLFPGHQGFGD